MKEKKKQEKKKKYEKEKKEKKKKEEEEKEENPPCAGIFWGSSHTSDLKIGTPMATLTGAWCYRVSAGTSRPGASIL